MRRCDLLIVGGGLVGLATAWRFLERHPGRRLVLLEKEDGLVRHQSGHNSGVLHTGIYYRPGSLKAELCREGRERMLAFCRDAGIPRELSGKVIVATEEAELPALERLRERAAANGVPCERVGAAGLRDLEPHARGVAALHVPGAGVLDYRRVGAELAERVRAAGGAIHVGTRVTGLAPRPEGIAVESTAGTFEAARMVGCAGLHSDRLAALGGRRPAARIVPFRGEYYELSEGARHLCRSLIYPLPDPRFPFLGVHFTRGIDGAVECGPNAVLATAREGYRRRDVDLRDLAESVLWTGFARLAAKHWRMGLGELWRSLSRAAFARALQRLVPEVRAEDLRPAGAGVRAQAVAPDGSPVDDFLIEEDGDALHVLNAPSPAATASLAIGERLARQAAERLR